MAHPTVVINGVQYPNVPQIQIPKAGTGTAVFYDATDTDVTASDVLAGKKFINASGEGTGNIPSKSAATITPTSADQTIAANQYLSGAQTIEGIVVSGLTSAVLASGVTVKVGTATDDDSVMSVSGSLSAAVISQDSTTKVLSIS